VKLSPFRAAAATLAMLALSACTTLPGQPTPNSIPIQPNDVTNFQALYTQNCQGCHGINGKGGATIGLATPNYAVFAGAEQIRKITANGVPGTAMPAFAHSSGGLLTDAQVDALVTGIEKNFATQQAVTAPLPPYTSATPGNAAHGAAGFQKFCASCHGPEGKGSAASRAGSIVDPAYLALTSDQALRTTVVVGRPDLGSPDFCSDIPGQCMSAQDVSDVVAWLASQRTPFAGQPYPNRAETAPATGAARP
jgi:cytochrome c oxidase cbb3-type subunit III